MKKTIILVFVLAMILTVLSGCGSARDLMPAQTPPATADLLPDISPVLTPDLDDGIVKDEDGMIEEREPTGTAVPKASPSASPAVSPAVTAKP